MLCIACYKSKFHVMAQAVGPSSLLHRRWSQAETPPLFPSPAPLNTSPPQGVVPGCRRLRARCNPLPHLRCWRLAYLTRCKKPLDSEPSWWTCRAQSAALSHQLTADSGRRGWGERRLAAHARVECVQCVAV